MRSHHHGCNLRQALRSARSLGCRVRCPRRTGEVLVSHPAVPGSVRVNARRKDAPRALTGLLDEVCRVTRR